MTKPRNPLRYQGFPNGLSLEEGVQRAADWWDETGREVITRMMEGKPADKAKPGHGMMSGLKFTRPELATEIDLEKQPVVISPLAILRPFNKNIPKSKPFTGSVGTP